MLKEWKLIEGQTIAIDSFKIRAVNSLKNKFNQSKIDRYKDYIDNKIKEYQDQLDHQDEGTNKENIEHKINYQREKKTAYVALENQLNQSGESQISTVDPDAKAAVLHRNIVNVGYNVQAGCDEKHKLFINAQTGSVNDTNARADMAIEAKDLVGEDQVDELADKGYTTGLEMDRCTKNGITTYCSPKEHSSPDNGLYPMKDFEFNPEKDRYMCPQKQTLHTNGKYYKRETIK